MIAPVSINPEQFFVRYVTMNFRLFKTEGNVMVS